MTPTARREKPKPRIYPVGPDGVIRVDMPFAHDDGWNEVTVGWHDDQYSDGRGCWIAECSTQGGCIADSEVSEIHALAELVRGLAAMCHMYEKREVELHRAIYNSPDVLVKELREAEADLHEVQGYITTHVEPSATDNWDAGLRPLWRAERAVEAFAARISDNPSRTEETNA